MENDRSRQLLVDVLMDKVASERYPSSTMLDLLEASLTSEELPRYIEMLLNHVEEDTYPSIPMIRRVERLT